MSTISPLERRARARAIVEARNNNVLYNQYKRRMPTGKIPEPAETKEDEKDDSNFFIRSLSTIGDFFGNVVSGTVKGIEGIVDAGAGIVGAVGGIFSDDFKDDVQGFIKRDYTSEYVANPLNDLFDDSYLKDGGIIESVASGIGQMLPAVAVSIATAGVGTALGKAATVTASAAQKAALATTAVSAAGSGTEAAYQDGAEYYAGLGYGTAVGAVEAGTEKLTGGFTKKLYGKGVVDNAGKALVGKEIADIGVKRVAKGALEEGAEEIIAEAANPALKSIYKGKDAFSEYGSGEYWKSVGEAGVVGSLTGLGYSNTVGRIVGEKTGKAADIKDSLLAIENQEKKKNQLFTYDNYTEANKARISENIKGNFKNIETVLKKANDSKRAKLIKEFELSDFFEANGSMKADFADSLELNNHGKPSDLDNRYVSPGLQEKPEAVTETLESITEDLREAYMENEETSYEKAAEKIKDVKAFKGELPSTAKTAYSKLKKGLNRLNTVSGQNINLVVTESHDSFNGSLIGNTIYIGRDTLDSNTWAETLIHEYTHYAEGTKEYRALVDFLSGDASLAKKTLSDLLNKSGYGFTEAKTKKILDKYNRQKTAGNTTADIDSREEIRYNKKEIYKQIPKSEYAIISNRIMEDNSQYMARNQELPKYGKARSADYFYVYENFAPGNFGVLKQIKITDANREYIASIEAKIGENNGKQTIGSTSELNRVLEVLKTRTRRNHSNNAFDSKGRANSDNGGVSLGESESDGIGHSQKSDGTASNISSTANNRGLTGDSELQEKIRYNRKNDFEEGTESYGAERAEENLAGEENRSGGQYPEVYSRGGRRNLSDSVDDQRVRGISERNGIFERRAEEIRYNRKNDFEEGTESDGEKSVTRKAEYENSRTALYGDSDRRGGLSDIANTGGVRVLSEIIERRKRERISNNSKSIYSKPKNETQEILSWHAEKENIELFFIEPKENVRLYDYYNGTLYIYETASEKEFVDILNVVKPIKRNVDYNKVARISKERWDKFLEWQPDAYITRIPIQQFLDMTTDSYVTQRQINALSSKISESVDIENIKNTSGEYIYLEIDLRSGAVANHEGRHRMTALLNNGNGYADVFVVLTGGSSKESYKHLEVNGQFNNETHTINLVKVNSKQFGGIIDKIKNFDDGNIRYNLKSEQSVEVDEEGLDSSLESEIIEELTAEEKKYLRLYNSELGAHLTANLLGTESFVDRLIRENTTIAEKILNKISDIKARLRSFANPEARAEYKKIKKAEKLYLDAVEKAGYAYVGRKIIAAIDERDEEAKFSFKTDGNGKTYWQIETEQDIFKGITSANGLQKAAYNFLLRGDKGTKVADLIDGEKLEFIRISASEYVYGTDSKKLTEEQYKQKMRMSTSVIDLIENAFVKYDAPDHKNHKMFSYGFKNYQGRVGIDETIFKYIVRVGKSRNGMIFYDICLEVDGKVPRANRTSLINKSTSVNSISQNSEKINTSDKKTSDKPKFSLKPNEKVTKTVGEYQYTQNQYNRFGWARHCDALTSTELDDLYSKIQAKTTLRMFKQSSAGEAIIEVNNKPHTTLDVDNVFVFVKGGKSNFIITRVVRFAVDTETEMEIIKEKLYERGTCSDTYLALYQKEGLTREYRREDSPTFATYRTRRSNGEDGRGTDSNNRGREEYRSGYTSASGEAGKAEIKFSLKSDNTNSKITAEMTDEERYEILNKRVIKEIPVAKAFNVSNTSNITEISTWNDINKYLGNNKRKIVHKIASEFGVIGKVYDNNDINLSFEFSANSFRESYNKQGHNYVEFAKMFSVFNSVIDSAVGIEIHNREDYKYDPTLENVFVLASAYIDSEHIVPVKLEVKKFKDKQNTLYVAISLNKIKKTEVLKSGNTDVGVTQNSRSVNISISDLFKKINPSDKSFLKYIPDAFLNQEQLKSKRESSKKFFASSDELKFNLKSTKKVEMSEGEYQKQKANYTKEKVFSKKEVGNAILSVPRVSTLPKTVQNDIVESLWISLNSIESDTQKDNFIKLRTSKILSMLWQESENFSELPSDEIRAVENTLRVTLEKLVKAGGTPSQLSKTKAEYADTNVGKWMAKAEYEARRSKVVGALMNKAKRMRDIKFGTYLNASQFKIDIFKGSIEKLSRIDYRGNLNKSGTRNILKELSEWYNPENPIFKATEGSKEKTNELYDDYVADLITELASREGELELNELYSLDDVMGHLIHFVESFKRIKRNGEYVEAKPIAENFIELQEEEKKVKWFGWVRKGINRWISLFGDNESVVKRMDSYEDGFFTSAFNNLREANIQAELLINEIGAPLTKFYKEHKSFVKDSANKTVEYNGVNIPLDRAMLLYMTLKRDHAIMGLAKSGFSYVDKKTDKTVHIDGFATENIYGEAEANGMAEILRDRLYEQFNGAEKEYIALAEKIFNDDCKKLKEKTDIDRKGYSNVLDGYYVPISRGPTAKDLDSSFLVEMDRVSKASFNKETVKGSKNELFIESLEYVLHRHIKGVSLYSALSPALYEYNLLYNLDVGTNPNKPKSIKVASENVWREGDNFFRKLVSDIQGIPAESTFDLPILSEIRAGFAKYQLGANPKVWASQLTSFCAASAILDVDCLIKAWGISGKDVNEYCSLAKVRNENNAAAKAQGVLDKVGKVGEVLMWPIGWVDGRVIRRLFSACQVQIQKNEGLKLGTEENKKRAGQLLKEVIIKTQQNSLATERSAAMRSGNEILKTVTMFSADAMKVFGRFIDAHGELLHLKAKRKAATDPTEIAKLDEKIKAVKKKACKSTTALLSSAIFMAAIAWAFRLLYNKDDEPKEEAKNIAVDVFGNMIGGIPIGRDIYDKLLQDYDVNNYAYTAFNDLLESVQAIFDTASAVMQGEADGKDFTALLRKVSYSAGQALGIPTRNVYNTVTGLTRRFSPSSAYWIEDKFYTKNYRSDLAKAIEDEDEDMIAMISGLMLDENVGGIDDSSARKSLNELMSSGFDVLPKSTPKTLTYEDEEITLSGREQKTFKNIYSTANESLASLVKLSQYTSATDEVKAKSVKFIYDVYYNLAVEDAIGVELENKNVLFAEAIDIEKLALIISSCKNLTADIDAGGNAVSGSRKRKIQAYVNSLRLTAAQKYMIMGYLGYKNVKGEDVVRAFIKRLNLSAKEKERLLAYSGYAA